VGIIFITYCLYSEYVSLLVEIRWKYTRNHSFHNRKSDKSITKFILIKFKKIYFEEHACI